jgi:hypothetical protein
MKHVLVVPVRRISKARALAMYALFLFAVVAGAHATSCQSVPTSDIKVRSAVDAKANIKGYKSYAWYGSAGLLVDRTGVWVPKNADAQADVEFLVDKSLRDKGLVAVRERPELLVALLFVGSINDVEKIAQTRGGALPKLDPVGEGALLIELIDAETGKTVWLGGAEGELRQSRSVEDGRKRLAYAVDKVFAQLPR